MSDNDWAKELDRRVEKYGKSPCGNGDALTATLGVQGYAWNHENLDENGEPVLNPETDKQWTTLDLLKKLEGLQKNADDVRCFLEKMVDSQGAMRDNFNAKIEVLCKWMEETQKSGDHS